MKEEQKIIHQVENKFNMRMCQRNFGHERKYLWLNVFLGNQIEVCFTEDSETENYIELRYVRGF